MTRGQQAVWAAVYARHLAAGLGPVPAAYHAVKAVQSLQEIDRRKLDDDARAMLEDILGVPR